MTGWDLIVGQNFIEIRRQGSGYHLRGDNSLLVCWGDGLEANVYHRKCFVSLVQARPRPRLPSKILENLSFYISPGFK